MWLIYGKVDTGTDETGIWPVGVTDTEKDANSLIKLLQERAVSKFKEEIAKGFTTGDSISIANELDPNAHYVNYIHEDEVPVIDYFYKELPHFPFIDKVYSKLVYDKKDLPPSVKWDDENDRLAGEDHVYEYL